MPDALNEWVSVGEAATIVGVSPSTIRRYERDGILVCWRTPTNVRRYRRADIERLLVPQPPAEAEAAS
jgi:DNA-binding transcriptional MerR regulator